MELCGLIVCSSRDFHHLQGFHKVDTDRWEFANGGFLRGKRHLLKNIRRRKSPQSQQPTFQGGSMAEGARSELGSEIETLRKEKSVLMQEVVELQQQQHGTAERMESVKHRIQASEQNQKQMVSFLAKVVQNPVFLDRLKQMKQQRELRSPRPRRRFLKHKPLEPGGSGAAVDGQVVRYQPDLVNTVDLPEIPGSSDPDYLLHDVVGWSSAGIKGSTYPLHDIPLEDLAAPATTALELADISEPVRARPSRSRVGEPFFSREKHVATPLTAIPATTLELADIPEPVRARPSSSGVEDPFFSRERHVVTPLTEPMSEYFVSFSEELAKERTFPEFPSPGIIKQEDIWNIGFDLSSGMSSSSLELWGNVASYNVPGVGPSGPSEFHNILGGSSGLDKWTGDESPLDDPKIQAFPPIDDSNIDSTVCPGGILGLD